MDSEVFVGVSLSLMLAACCSTVRWWCKCRRRLRITAVALGSDHLRGDLLAAGAISEGQHDRGMNECDFKMIRGNEQLVSRLRRECPILLDVLNERVFNYL